MSGQATAPASSDRHLETAAVGARLDPVPAGDLLPLAGLVVEVAVDAVEVVAGVRVADDGGAVLLVVHEQRLAHV